MTPDYKSPLRVTWVAPSDEGAASLVLKRLVEGRVLFLEVEINETSASALARALGDRVPIMLTVMGGADALAAFVGASAVSGKVDAILLDAEVGEEKIRDLAARFKGLSLGLWSADEPLVRFPTLLALAVKLGLPIAIPNTHAPASPLSASVKLKTAKSWYDAKDKPAAVVHDLFLAEAMGLDPWKNYKGCAAASALAHVRADGTVTACRTMPVAFGDLASRTLKELWSCEAASQLRAKLVRAPKPCLPCALASDCRGGCPGLADESGRDKSCGGCR